MMAAVGNCLDLFWGQATTAKRPLERFFGGPYKPFPLTRDAGSVSAREDGTVIVRLAAGYTQLSLKRSVTFFAGCSG